MRAIAAGIALLLLSIPALPQADTDPVKLFETKVRPLLEARCFKCHGPGAGRPKGDLRLDSREAALRGGGRGPALVPGKPAESLLVKALSHADPDLAMPPKEKLPEGEIAILVEWIRGGAAWTESKAAARREKPITDADRAWWSFQPVREPAVPAADPWARNEIDRFLIAKLKAEGLSPAPEAGRATLIRRACFDLHGLPPTPEEVAAFVSDPAPDAWEKLVDRLLASPRYGEKMARRWLDIVRWAESDGYKQDAFRPSAWPYRDWVIRAFNTDKPYDRFILEQLAGDEVAPDDPDVFVATGYFRLGIYEYNQRNVTGQWRDILNDITDVTGDAFLALGMGCARCHDHKYDPILRSDYYRLQAFIAGMLWRDDLLLVKPDQRAEADARHRAWEEKTAAIRAEIDAIEKKYVEDANRSILSKFLPEFQEVWRKPAAERTPAEIQIADLIQRQVIAERTLIDGKIQGALREKWSALKRKLAEFDALRPKDHVPALAATDAGPAAPPTLVPGDARPMEPGFLTVLGNPAPRIDGTATSTGRRTALARWLASPEHPLTARVLVNRLWQGHFGRGIVGTASDFGRLGEKPSHPELLDWLASKFLKSGSSIKAMHRLIMTSAAYRQSGTNPAAARARLKDPDNRWLWRMSPRRLEAEEVRDAMLAASGELDGAMGGPSVDPNAPRRTIYTKVLRNTRDPLLDAFDAPETFSSVPSRNSTTTATQALLLVNGRWPLERAQALAKRLRAVGSASDSELVDRAWRTAYGRAPSPAETQSAVAFLRRAPAGPRAPAADIPLVQVMPDRGGQAARFRSDRVEDRLRLGDTASLPAGDFTIEAVVILDSLYEDASVRVIASQWDGITSRPGWSFGVTSTKSRHQPRNLILQLTGAGGHEVVASDLRLDLHKTHYVAASVRIADTGETGVTFYMQDLSDPEAQLRVANVKHTVTGGYRSKAGLVIGGRDGQPGHGWDGLIDEVRLTRAALAKDQLLLDEAAEPLGAPVAAHWKFEPEPGFFADSAGVQKPLGRPVVRKVDAGASETSLVDFCHALLNSSEFLYVD